ncbi:MAG: hypothetical protein JWM34_3382 [Ilumatobacteraceae bacterium]|nr:hypothetical protein [Ilumatobacteraceae bacterium]
MIAIIGWIGAALCVASIVQKDQTRFRVLNLSACLVLIGFNAANGAWSGVLLNVVVAVLNARQLVVIRRARGSITAPASLAGLDSAPTAPPDIVPSRPDDITLVSA